MLILLGVYIYINNGWVYYSVAYNTNYLLS